MGTDRPTRPSRRRPSRRALRGGRGGVVAAPSANWDLGLFAVLLGFSIFSDLTATRVDEDLLISGSFLALVLSMVFLGGTPATLIGSDRDRRGLAALARSDPLLHPQPPQLLALPAGRRRRLPRGRQRQPASPTPTSASTSLVFGIFLLALAINFLMLAVYARYVSGTADPRPGADRADPAAAVGAHGRADGGRGRLPLRTRSGSPGSRSSASSSSPSSTCSAPCSSPSSGPRSWRSAPTSWPASRSGC